MILGIGKDLLDMRRFEKTLEKYGERFIAKTFTDEEIAEASRRRTAGKMMETYAKRYAAKEAASKALGTGIAEGVTLKDIGVTNTDRGAPKLTLTGGAEKRLKDLVPEGMEAHIHITLTDEPPLAEAMVIIEALPASAKIG
ncbi:MAG: holo-ACP synthase [Pseudobdellovibrionaceae bacterium]